jgi:hypothetical protein
MAERLGHVELQEGFAWLGTDAAILTFGVATVFEVVAYYVPWFDNVLDTVAGPAAVVAGTVISAAVIVDMSPFLQWTLALIAGGGSAALFHGSTSLVRLTSSATTGGFGNPVISTAEAGVSSGLSLLAVTWPALAACLVVVSIVWVMRAIRYLRRQRRALRPKSVEPNKESSAASGS